MRKKYPADPKHIEQLVANCAPAARGVLQCLHMLAEEAGSLNLPATRTALKRAMQVCASESRDIVRIATTEGTKVPRGGLIH